MNLTKQLISLDTLPLKLLSLVVGFTFWFFISHFHYSTVWVNLPLCFYGVDEKIAQAPEYIRVQLSGKRSVLQSLDYTELGLHIDKAQLHSGKNLVNVNAQSLLLPDSINLVHYEPTNVIIEVA